MYKKLIFNQLESKFKVLRDYIFVPEIGWIKTIREAYGMSVGNLADRLNISSPGVVRLEKSEAAKTIKLETLEKIAQALNCDLQYCLVPRVNPEKYLLAEAKRKSALMTEEVVKTMELENQGVSQERKKEIYNRFLEEALSKPQHYVWKKESD